MKNFLICIYEHVKLLLNPIIINAFTFYDSNGCIKPKNWGDDINYYFLKSIIKKPIVLYNRTSLASRLKLKNYLVIGSTIDMLCKKNTEVWGAGIINGDKPLNIKPRKVYAVRGPLTRAKLLSEGVECPEVYGDPAMLVSLYYRPDVRKLYNYGIISHVSNKQLLNTISLDGILLKDCKNVLIIDFELYNKWQDIIDEICSCERIISSSLHGLIIAETYRIPNLWIEFGKPLLGGHFKFHDFFLSIGMDREGPVIISNFVLSRDLEKLFNTYKSGFIDLQPLLKAAPFVIRL